MATYRALSHELTAERTVQFDRLLLPLPGQDSPDGAVPKGVGPKAEKAKTATAEPSPRLKTSRPRPPDSRE